jgi:hypothetical protein
MTSTEHIGNAIVILRSVGFLEERQFLGTKISISGSMFWFSAAHGLEMSSWLL